MTTTPKQASLEAVMPCFIVSSLKSTLDFYTNKLGFEIEVVLPAKHPFFGMVRRDRVTLMLKEIAPEIHPQPNHQRHEWAPWDAYILHA